MKNNDPLVSVIMSEFNTPSALLTISIQSILKQTFDNFEFIIVDDCGDKDVEEFVKKFKDKRIRVIKNKKNNGLISSLNSAILAARGKYLVRMDGDDVSSLNRIEKLVSFIELNPQFAVVSSRVMEYCDGKKIGILGKSGEKLQQNILSGDVPAHPASIINRNSIINVGGYHDFPRAEDFSLWCEFLIKGYRIFVLKDVLYKYNVNVEDYEKRKFVKRKGELTARVYYNRKMKGGTTGYIRIVKSVLSGLLPISFVRFYRKWFVLSNE